MRARRATGASMRAVTGGDCLDDGERRRTHAPVERSERAYDDRGGGVAIEPLPGALGNGLHAQPAAYQGGTAGSTVHPRGDPVERELESGVGDREAREHLGAEEPRAKPSEPPNWPEPVACPAGRVNGSPPVWADAELVRRE